MTKQCYTEVDTEIQDWLETIKELELAEHIVIDWWGIRKEHRMGVQDGEKEDD